MTDTQAFARTMQRELSAFMDKRSPGKRHRRRPVQRPTPPKTKDVLVVKLVVRKRYIAPDEVFYHFSDRLSQLEAEIDAKRAAVEAGYPVFGYVVYVKRGAVAK